MTIPSNNSNMSPDEMPGTSEQLGQLCEAARTFARDLAVKATSLLKVLVQLTPAGVETLSYAEFIDALGRGDCCWKMEATAEDKSATSQRLGGETIWIELARPIAHAIVDCLLGEPNRTEAPPNRSLTVIELGLIEPFFEIAAEAVTRSLAISTFRPGEQKAWSIGPNCETLETLKEAHADETVFLATFATSLTGGEGMMRVYIPGISTAVVTDDSQEQAAPSGPAEIEYLSDTVELTVGSLETEVPTDDLAELGVGDVLVTDIPAESELIVRINGKERFGAKLGSRNGRRAITVTRDLEDQGDGESQEIRR